MELFNGKKILINLYFMKEMIVENYMLVNLLYFKLEKNF